MIDIIHICMFISQQKKRPQGTVFFIVEAWVGMFASPMATVAKRNLTHCLQWFAAWQNSTRHLQTFARMRTGAGSPHQNFTTKKRPQGTVFFIVEAWVGIEPA